MNQVQLKFKTILNLTIPNRLTYFISERVTSYTWKFQNEVKKKIEGKTHEK